MRKPGASHGVRHRHRADTEELLGFRAGPARLRRNGRHPDEVIAEMRAAIAFDIESLREHREPVPAPRCTTAVVAMSAAG